MKNFKGSMSMSEAVRRMVDDSGLPLKAIAAETGKGYTTLYRELDSEDDGAKIGVDTLPLLGCVCKPSSRNRVTTGKCATMTSLKTSGSGLSPYCQQKVLLVEGDRLVTSETFSMLYIGCCEPDLHGELCQRNMVRGKPYIPDSGVGRKEDIWLLSLSFLPYRLTWTTS